MIVKISYYTLSWAYLDQCNMQHKPLLEINLISSDFIRQDIGHIVNGEAYTICPCG